MNNSPEKSNDASNESIESSQEGDLILESSDLLRGQRMVLINHKGDRYRLIETRNGKLILQK
ncbi:MAG: hemin uptake protein HemP [Planctomycetaceae bacterium]|nr:hemin uptake protein HemP [Planctomycetaceae bacterium]